MAAPVCVVRVALLLLANAHVARPFVQHLTTTQTSPRRLARRRVSSSSTGSSSSEVFLPEDATWTSLGLDPAASAALASLGYSKPTRVQAAALPAILAGRDVVALSPTGSGKTLAYLAPVVASLDASRRATQALIIVPTRELGLQVASEARRLAAALARERSSNHTKSRQRLQVMSCLSGSKLRRQRAWAWTEPPHVVVGNARPVADMIERGGLVKGLGTGRSHAVRYVVVDEVDAFFDDSRYVADRDCIGRALAALSAASGGSSARRQTLFAAATVEQPRYFAASKLADWCVGDDKPTYAAPGLLLSESSVSGRRPPTTLRHAVAACATPAKRLTATRRVLDKLRGARVLVFVDSSRPIASIARALASADGHRVAALATDADLDARARALADFRLGRVDVLLATDAACSRGIDVPEIEAVVNLDAPPNARLYLHRAGRAARCGNSGVVVTVVADQERFAFDRILRYCGVFGLEDSRSENNGVPVVEDFLLATRRLGEPSPSSSSS